MLSIRAATVNDIPLLLAMIQEFAEFERERHLLRITESDLERDGFGPHPRFRIVIAEWQGQPAGYALFFDFYSTWEGKPGLFLEDLFVRQQYRSNRIGSALLSHIAAIAKRENYYGMRWEVLDWNQPAIDFYHKIGATFLDNRKAVMLADDALRRMAAGA